MTYEVQRPEGLPPHQPPIETSSVTRLRQNLRLLLDVKKTTGYPMMALIVSWPGYGKTIAVYAFCNNLAEQSQSTKPRAIPFRIQDDPTPRSIAESLLLAYGERADDSRYKLMAKIREIVPAANTDLLIADEADHLNAKTFETLRYIFDETGVSVAVIGQPTLYGIVRQHKKFMSRIGLIQKFEPLTEAEILSTVLPNLIFPQWQFDPDNEAHQQLGKYIWGIVKPSFRDLRDLLSRASMRALGYGDSRLIDKQIIDMAIKMGGGMVADDEADDDDEAGDDSELGEMEIEALRRQRTKPRKKR